MLLGGGDDLRRLGNGCAGLRGLVGDVHLDEHVQRVGRIATGAEGVGDRRVVQCVEVRRDPGDDAGLVALQGTDLVPSRPEVGHRLDPVAHGLRVVLRQVQDSGLHGGTQERLGLELRHADQRHVGRVAARPGARGGNPLPHLGDAAVYLFTDLRFDVHNSASWHRPDP